MSGVRIPALLLRKPCRDNPLRPGLIRSCVIILRICPLTFRCPLAILANIRRRSDRWADGVERGKIMFSWEEARDLDELHKWWLNRSALLLEAIDFCESNHYQVDSADQFRQANLDVSLMSLDTDRKRQSWESIQSGRGIPSQQAMDELRRCLRPKGSWPTAGDELARTASGGCYTDTRPAWS